MRRRVTVMNEEYRCTPRSFRCMPLHSEHTGDARRTGKDRPRAGIQLASAGHAATGRNSCKTLVRDDRRSQDFTLGTIPRRNPIAHSIYIKHTQCVVQQLN